MKPKQEEPKTSFMARCMMDEDHREKWPNLDDRKRVCELFYEQKEKDIDERTK